MKVNPYSELADRAYWRKAIADRSMFDISGLWQPKFKLRQADPVSTYGSCFAQHIGRALRDRGFNWLITEKAPDDCPQPLATEFNYNLFSSRTGNIYTASLLLQWIGWAQGIKVPELHWQSGGRYIDPFRPAVEPQGFASLDDMLKSRATAIACFRRSILEASCFVFTLGLTESWFDADGFEYPMCPGTVAGEFSAERHKFANQNFDEVRSALSKAIAELRKMNPKLRILLTVSPVPLTATASGEHVLVATMYSKSVLRAVAGYMLRHPFVDYFPSYEIINGPPFAGAFFEPNKRQVHPKGVEFVMHQFFVAQGGTASARPPAKGKAIAEPARDVCEESLLDAFGAKA